MARKKMVSSVVEVVDESLEDKKVHLIAYEQTPRGDIKEKPRILNEQMMVELSVMAEQGMSLDSIATVLGFSKEAFAYLMNTSSLIENAYREGKAKGVQRVSAHLYDAALKGVTAAQIFYLKKVHPEVFGDKGDKEAIRMVGDGSGNNTSVISQDELTKKIALYESRYANPDKIEDAVVVEDSLDDIN